MKVTLDSEELQLSLLNDFICTLPKVFIRAIIRKSIDYLIASNDPNQLAGLDPLQNILEEYLKKLKNE